MRPATDDPTVVPRVEIAATVCGGCHTGPMQPTYEEWNTSGHAAVVPDALQIMSSSTNNISSCGRCHSGSVRLALINGQNPAHAHERPERRHHLRGLPRSAPDQCQSGAAPQSPLFDQLFFPRHLGRVHEQIHANTNINLCGQCHNARGAAWTDTSRAPHRSLQYNFLLGSVGQLWNGVTDSPATFNPGTHAGLPDSAQFSISGTFYLTNQCVSCHMQPDAPPASTHSHTFAVTSHDVCLNCHLD